MIEITINNKKYTFEKNITVLQACEQASIVVPRFCYNEKLSIAGSCRMCLVEIEKAPKPIASCAMPINQGMVIFTETPLVKKAREAVLEFLLINHPLDCPICDQGGECDLQDITYNYGSDKSRFFEYKRGVEDKECGPIIKTIMTRCIHCTRCIRFLTELAGLEIFGATGRGELMTIGGYLNKHIKTEISGNLIDLCPVGALTSKPYAFLARNWEFKPIESVDFSDALGSNIVIYSRNNSSTKILKESKTLMKDQILRILPKNNFNINETWISDKTRFCFDGLFFNRAENILILDSQLKKKKVNLNFNLLKDFLFKFKSLNNNKYNYLIGDIGSISSVEEIYFFYQFLKYYGTSNILINKTLYSFNTDLPAFYQFNSKLISIDDSDLILLVGINPRFESSMLNMRIRKNFFNKEILIANIGINYDFTYPTMHLGNSTRILLNIVEGKHIFCKKLRTAYNPLIIVGSEIGLRLDSKVLQNLLRFLGMKNFLNLKKNLNLNVVHSNLSQIHLCDLGLNISAQSPLYLSLINKFLLKEKIKTFIYNNVDNLSQKDISNEKNIHFCSLLTHNNFNGVSFFNFPINTLYEKSSITLNTEGLVQKAYKSITPLFNSRNSEDFFKALIKLDGNKKFITNNWLLKEAPFLKKISENRKHFYFNTFFLKEFQNKIYLTSFLPIINDFYKTDIISKNSDILLNCSIFFKNKTNFY